MRMYIYAYRYVCLHVYIHKRVYRRIFMLEGYGDIVASGFKAK